MPWRTQSCSTDLRIRRARRSDYAELTALWCQAMARFHKHLGTQRLAVEEDAVSQVYLPACDVWIAESSETLGFVALRRGCEVAGLFVSPDAQRRGVGRALLDHVRNDDPLHLEVAAPNFAARQFYLRYGFHEVSRRHDPDLDEELLHMRLRDPNTGGTD